MQKLFDISSCPYVKFEFPTRKEDDICRICFQWCTENSSCSNRYYSVYGEFIGRNPEIRNYEMLDGEPVKLPICDKCVHLVKRLQYINPDKKPPFNTDYKHLFILGSTFSIDTIDREND